MDPGCVDLEITETIAMADAEKSAGMLSGLKALGVGLDIDDFGTGYSSLSRLQSFRVDTSEDRPNLCLPNGQRPRDLRNRSGDHQPRTQSRAKGGC